MKFKMNCRLNVELLDIEIDALNQEDAENKLNQMTAQDLIEMATGFGDDAIEDVSAELMERDLTVEVFHVEYDLTENDFEYLGLNTEEERNNYLDYLPQNYKFDLHSVDAGKEDDEVMDAIESTPFCLENDLRVKAVNYKIVKER